MESKPIGKVISELRREKQLTVAEFADGVGVTERTVADWESGVSVPDAEQIAAMAEFFGIAAEALATGEISAHVCDDPAETKQIERDQDLFKLICRTVALAMGIAVTVLSFMDRMDPQNAVTMLGLGLTCLGIASFHKKK